MDKLVIPGEFNGPRESGNGGYTCGAVAALMDGPAQISLRSPVPLDEPLDVDRSDSCVRVRSGETLIAEGRPAPELNHQPPETVGPDTALEASTRYRGLSEGPFSHCFACGLAHPEPLGIFAGSVGESDLVATPWSPPEWTAGDDGFVRPEIVWAVLDCPTFFAAYGSREELPVAFLVREQARLDRPVKAGVEHVVVAWPIEHDGRKALAGSAVLSAGGETLAVAEVLMVEPSG